MNAPTLFDVLHPSDLRAVAARPRVRTTDGVTARAAAKKMESGNGPLMQAIRTVTYRRASSEPVSAFRIGELVQRYWRVDGKPRWQLDSIRSAVSRAPFLVHVDNEGVTATGFACRRYRFEETA